jgi:hypothetical protein
VTERPQQLPPASAEWLKDDGEMDDAHEANKQRAREHCDTAVARDFIESVWPDGIAIEFRCDATDSPTHPPDTNDSHNPQ